MSDFSSLPSSSLGTPAEAGPTMETPHLDTHIRCIRGIEFDRTDLAQLLPDSELRISSTTFNAFAALIQDKADSLPSQPRDFIIFSSWIPALASGEVSEGRIYGSIDSHITAAVSRFRIISM